MRALLSLISSSTTVPRCGGFEDTPVIADGAREASSQVTEQLGFEEGVWNTGAVDRTERPRPAPASLVEPAGHHVFSDTAFTGNQDFCARLGRDGDFLPQRGHCPTGTH